MRMEFSAIPGLPLANITEYFGNSNFSGQVIVLCLLLLSFAAWTVMVGKHLDLSRLRVGNRNFAKRLSRTDRVIDTDPAQLKRDNGSYSRLTRDALEAYARGGVGTTTQARVNHVENALQRAVGEATLRYEAKMVVLGSIVTGAPFLGLLGTVWGVMDAFGSIAVTGGGTIQSLAPGVSGALLTTVAGLLVAIPSVFGYNYLLTQVKIMTLEIENFASSMGSMPNTAITL